MMENLVWFGSDNSYTSVMQLVQLGMEKIATDDVRLQAFNDKVEKLNESKASVFDEHPAIEFMTRRAGVSGRTGVIKISGGMIQRAKWWHQYYGIASYDAINMALMAAEADESIDTVFLHLDSPGGMVSGIDTVTDTIYSMTKPVIGFTDGIMASAGYWVGASAKILVGTRLSTIGSVGALIMRQDMTKYLEKLGISMEIHRAGDNKARINPYETPREEDIAGLNEYLNQAYSAFLDHIAASPRKLSRQGLEKLTEHGRTFYGTTALEKGMLDALANEREVLAYIDNNMNNNTNSVLSTL